MILNYFEYLCNAYIIHLVNRYDIPGKRLVEINDNYPKYVVSMDEFYENTDYQGIRHMHLRQFLSTKDL